jgi:mRNA interferase MazF
MAVDFQPGDVILLEFPYSGAGGKHRPALVLLDTGDSDVVVARITSQAGRDAFDITINDWKEAGLKLPSIVRIHKLATLENH